ncbi:MAG TPA: sugar phosphate nucleotidyltransferase [Thermomicrobiales bacterium]|nr:sugar phosphate nucleotidyltransferase [Thermomicrobiales bacterium]HRA46706.1 sugar phosphate nucleotidyltransferase [Thermomicrobiales bacterium]
MRYGTADLQSPDIRKQSFWTVIPAGGSGTRLWPLSRAAKPKFLLPLVGEASLLQQTAARLTTVAPIEQTMVICGPAHAAAIARQLPSVEERNVIVEPSPRGSGPAIVLAAALIAHRDPNAIMGSFAADHDIIDIAAFTSAVQTAIAAAETDSLVTIGLNPTRPETGYGYIERSEEVIAVHQGQHAYRSLRFVEKPPKEVAEQYIAAGTFLWNASMFIWRVSTFLKIVRDLEPDLYKSIMRIIAAWESPNREYVMNEIWNSLPTSTIDQAIMERCDRVAVVPAEFGWSDVGDWHGLGELIQQDSLGNSVRGDLVKVETRNSVVWSETKRLIALVGLENIVVVDTDDALLVIDRGRAQDVRKIVEQLKALSRHEYS